MPVKRRAPKSRINLSPEAYAAFEAGDEEALRAAIGQKPWEISPFDAGPKPAPYDDTEWRLPYWRKAREIRLELMRGIRRKHLNAFEDDAGA